MEEQPKKIEYPVKRFRMNHQTFKKLERIKKRLNKSWNLTFIEIIEKYEDSLR